MDYLHSVPTEQGVLVSLLSLADGVDQYVQRLNRDYFSGKHQIIFDAIKAIHDRGEQIDFILVWDEIKKNPLNLHHIDEQYMLTLNAEAPTLISTLEQHIEKLHRLMVRRKFVDISVLMQGMAKDFTTNLDDMLINVVKIQWVFLDFVPYKNEINLFTTIVDCFNRIKNNLMLS
nr:DnaB-like helicase N-terminal domain-containing protein [Acinetobacter baumannii]